MNLQTKEVREYFKFRGSINSLSFVELMATNPNAGIVGLHEGQKKIFEAFELRVPPGEEAKELGLDFEYKYSVLVAACGRRFGKSFAASILGATELMVPFAKVLIVSYQLDNADVIFKMIYKMMIGLGIEMPVCRRQDRELELINGSTLRVASVDNVEAKLGNAVSLLIMDEAKLFKKDLYTTVLMPMLFDYAPLSRTLLISSPAHGWFEEAYNQGQSDDVKWRKHWSINLPTHTNPVVPRSVLQEMEETMPPHLYAQEVLGQFTSKHGAVFPEFDEERNVYVDDDYPFFRDWLAHGNTVIHTIDSGYAHYFSAQWIMYVEELDTFFVFQEYIQNKTMTPVHAENMKEIEHSWGMEVAIRYADPAASQQIADFAEHDFMFSKAAKNLRETINNLNTLFFQTSKVTGKPRLMVHKRCTETIRELKEIQWKEDSAGITREQAASGVKPFKPDTGLMKTDWDAVDSLRYGMYSFEKHNRVGLTILDSFVGGHKSTKYEEMQDEMSMQEMGYYRIG